MPAVLRSVSLAITMATGAHGHGAVVFPPPRNAVDKVPACMSPRPLHHEHTY
jgi:hypothetical protein